MKIILHAINIVCINLDEAEADLDPEEATETDNITDCSLNLVLEESFEDETGVMDNNQIAENSKKRKHIEPLKVVFVGKLPTLF